jgi:hypothetical protein
VATFGLASTLGGDVIFSPISLNLTIFIISFERTLAASFDIFVVFAILTSVVQRRTQLVPPAVAARGREDH